MITRSRFSVFDTSPLDNEHTLIGWWPFDDGKATDFSGNQNNGVATGSPVFAGSEVGNSYGISSGNYFTVPTATKGASNPIATNRVSAAVWLKPNVTSRGDIISVWGGDGAPANDQFVLLYGLTAGKPEFFCATGGAVRDSGVGPTAMSAGIWYHVAGTYDGSNVAVYLNGKLEASAPFSGNLGVGTNNPIQIGGSAGATNLLNGSLADARVYNRALSAQEINELYNKTITRLAASPDEWEMAVLQAAAAAAAQAYAAFSIPQHDGQVYSQMIGY